MTRRAARIYPLYFVVTCVLMFGLEIGIGIRSSPPPSLHVAFFYNLLLVQSWGLSYSIIITSWSVSTELAAYILFPLLLTAAVQSRPYLAIATLLVSAVAICAVASVHFNLPTNGPLDVPFDYSPWPMVRCLSEFTIGLLAFRASTHLRSHDLPALLRPNLASPILLAAIVGLLFLPMTDLVLIILFALLIITVSIDEKPVAWLASRPIVLLGELSYAIYLLHFEFLIRVPLLRAHVLPFLGKAGAAVFVETTYFGALFVTAWICYTYIEKPGRHLVRHWARRLDTSWA